MNRKPKYRAWDKTEKKWATNLIVGGILYELQANKDADVLDSYDLFEYSGLIDKGGKDIFEGDIIKISDHYVDAMGYERNIVLVGFNKGAFMYGPSPIDPYYMMRYLYMPSEHMEVIGNVVEHKHLLK